MGFYEKGRKCVLERYKEDEEKWIRFKEPFHVSLFLLSNSVPCCLFIYVLT